MPGAFPPTETDRLTADPVWTARGQVADTDFIALPRPWGEVVGRREVFRGSGGLGFQGAPVMGDGLGPSPRLAVVDPQHRWFVLDVETTPGRALGLVALTEQQVDVGFTPPHGPPVGLGHVELHAAVHRAGGLPTRDTSGVEKGASRRLIVPCGPGVEGVDPMQPQDGITDAVVGPHHCDAQHGGLHDAAGRGLDREPEQGPAGVGVVPFEVPDAHARGLGAVVGAVGEGTVHVGPRGALDLDPLGIGMRGGEHVTGFDPTGFRAGRGRVTGFGGGLLVGCGRSDRRPQREGQGVGRASGRRTGQGTTHYGWCLHIPFMSEKESERGLSPRSNNKEVTKSAQPPTNPGYINTDLNQNYHHQKIEHTPMRLIRRPLKSGYHRTESQTCRRWKPT